MELPCAGCGAITPHRTASVKINRGGMSGWFQLCRICARCPSLNPIITERYRLNNAPAELPSQLAMEVCDQLKDSELTLSELLSWLRRRRDGVLKHVLA